MLPWRLALARNIIIIGHMERLSKYQHVVSVIWWNPRNLRRKEEWEGY